MIYDCFMFFDELDVLELRLNILSPRVDKFVLVESNKTHSWRDKPLLFSDNRQRYQQFEDKIIYVLADHMPKKPYDRWAIENYQRNCILSGIADAHLDDDYAVVSDVDEIWNPDVWPFQQPKSPFSFKIEQRGFWLNSEIKSIAAAPVAASVRTMVGQSPQRMRMRRDEFPFIENGGWHFSWMQRNTPSQIDRKLKAYAHAEYDCLDGVKEWVYNSQIIKVQKPEADLTLPKHIRDNLEKYQHLMRWP